VREQLLAAGAASVASVVLLDKKARRKVSSALRVEAGSAA
jgi:hypoxanthine-guanine phosphoribosyltransferase